MSEKIEDKKEVKEEKFFLTDSINKIMGSPFMVEESMKQINRLTKENEELKKGNDKHVREKEYYIGEIEGMKYVIEKLSEGGKIICGH